uniref:Retrovirus-related Pol polyprotein from transposon TNT 1-94 n=1 Tax=Heterorhabditis bacteriophora TaxID=37862 RepID=A0A1I7XDZ7_HETBA
MDPMNERKVFDIMVKKLSGTGNLAKTQYFLLTPKLLHGLEFGRKVTVQIVHNGPTLSSNSHVST